MLSGEHETRFNFEASEQEVFNKHRHIVCCEELIYDLNRLSFERVTVIGTRGIECKRPGGRDTR